MGGDAAGHPSTAGAGSPRAVELLVYGATSAGVAAATAAGELGVQVLLVEPGRHVGGMTSGGLGYTDVGDLRALGGAAARFRRDVAAHYGVEPGRYAGPEPHVAETILSGWLERAGVEIAFGERMTAVDVVDGTIRSVQFASGLRVDAGVVIDATYEGDLLAQAGVPFAVGRESRALHGERWAGRRELLPGRHAMPPWISPFTADPTGLTAGAILPQLRDAPLAEVGEGDGGIMSYGYRLCLSTADDRVPFTRPDGYDEEYWELGRRLFARWRADSHEEPVERLLGLEPNLPGGKADGNSIGPFSLSVLDGTAWEYPTAALGRREQIRRHHHDHAAGFLWFLSHDPAVPRAVRERFQRWGLARDEFVDTEHLPHQLYVREARRMRGEALLTEHDLVAGRLPHDTVALGSYHLDIREVQRTWTWVPEHPRPIAMVVTEGYLSVPVPIYGIPYRALLPQRRDARNLLVPVCLSASHVAFSSIRMEPQYPMLGEAAGVAAALALHHAGDVHEVPVAELLAQLERRSAVLRP